MDRPWRIELFGQLRACPGEQRAVPFQIQKSGALLAYLAYHPQHPQPRELVTELLWPEDGPEEGRGKLRDMLYALRRLLPSPTSPGGSLLIAARTTLCLDPAAFSTDVAQFQAALRAAAPPAAPDQRLEQLTVAVGLYRGELLPGYYEGWVLTERQALAEQYLEALRQWVAVREAAGDLEGALGAARQAVSADPLREEGHYDVMRLAAALGQPSAALSQYQELERLLREQLAETPSAEARALAEELRQNARTLVVARPSLLGSGPPAAAPAPPPEPLPAAAPGPVAAPLETPLPVQLNRFFGREEEIARLTGLLSVSAARLVTVTGPGGSGKTRLAIAVAGRLQEAWEGAVAFVSLAEVTEAGRIPAAMAEALALPRSTEAEPLAQVVAHLRDRPWLLVLDNLEHLVAEGALLVRRLLEQAPTLVCLATSRQRLGIAGEREFALLPLPTPRRADSPERLAEYPSVQLFLDRAQAVRADFALTAANAAEVAALCDRLEGLPLAIELAAARAGVLSPEQMLAQLQARFEFLVSRQRDLPTRHRTLRATIDASYQLLSPDLQRFFARLSVFRGGWSLAAAEAVAGVRCWVLGVRSLEESHLTDPTDPTDPSDHPTPNTQHPTPNTLDALEQLQEYSLILAEEGSGETRYRLLETLREHGTEQLTATEAEELARRHAAYYLSLVLASEPAMRHPDRERMWLDRLEQEHDNLRAALLCCRSPADLDTGLRLGIALEYFWATRGYRTEGRQHLEALLAVPGGAVEHRARAAVVAGTLALYQGDPALARRHLETGLTAARSLDDPWLLTTALARLGEAASRMADPQMAQVYLNEAVPLQRAMGSRGGLGCSLICLGDLARDRGEFREALARYQEAEQVGRGVEDQRGSGWLSIRLGDASFCLNEPEKARGYHEQALEQFQRMDDRAGVAASHHYLGRLAQSQGQYAEARRLLQESLAQQRILGNRLDIANVLITLGKVSLSESALAEATALLEESLALARELEAYAAMGNALLTLGLVRHQAGDRAQGRSLLREGLALYLRLESPAHLANGLEGLIQMLSDEAVWEPAACLYGAVRAVRRSLPAPSRLVPPAQLDGRIAAVRAALGDAAFAAAEARGCSMSPAQALACALDVA